MQPSLLIVDMQEDFFRGGALAKMRPMLAGEIRRLMRYVRRIHVPVFHIVTRYRPDLSDATLLLREKGEAFCIEGTPGAEILHEVQPADDEAVIVKKRYSAFFGTDLEEHLSARDIDTIILTGVNTNACVRSTAVDAYQRDFRVIIPKESVGCYSSTQHRLSIRYIQSALGHVMDEKELRRHLRRHVQTESERLMATARSLVLRGSPRQAAGWYLRVAKRYPGTRHARVAKKRLEGLVHAAGIPAMVHDS